jgi:hypothetical protein
MANEEHVKRLKQGVREWNEWRVADRPTPVDLSLADLERANLIDADLRGAYLSGAKLTQEQLDEACGDANTKLPEGLKPPKPCPATPRQTVPPHVP